MQPTSKKKFLTIGLVIVVVIVLSVAILSLTAATSKLVISKPYASNLQFAHQQSENTIQFFTGASFASYDNSTHKTAILTPQYSLPARVNEVVWSKSAALFRATGYSPVDQLYPELIRKTLNPNGEYWWLVDFKNGTIKIIGSNDSHYSVSAAVWTSDTTFLAAEQPEESSGEALTSYTIAGAGSPVGALPQDGELVGGTNAQPIYAVPADGSYTTYALTPSTGKAQKLLSGLLKVLAVRSDGSTIALAKGEATAEDSEEQIGNLVLYDAQSKKTRTLETNFSGEAAWVAPSNAWLASGTHDDIRRVIVARKDKTTIYEPKAASKNSDPEELHAVGFIGTSVLVTNPDDQLIVGSAKAVSIPNLPNLSTIQGDIDKTKFRIVYLKDQNQYSIYIQQAPYETNRQLALAYIKQLGFDPNQLKLKWYANDGIDTGFYLPDGLVPVEDPEPVSLGGNDVGD